MSGITSIRFRYSWVLIAMLSINFICIADEADEQYSIFVSEDDLFSFLSIKDSSVSDSQSIIWANDCNKFWQYSEESLEHRAKDGNITAKCMLGKSATDEYKHPDIINTKNPICILTQGNYLMSEAFGAGNPSTEKKREAVREAIKEQYNSCPILKMLAREYIKCSSSLNLLNSWHDGEATSGLLKNLGTIVAEFGYTGFLSYSSSKGYYGYDTHILDYANIKCCSDSSECLDKYTSAEQKRVIKACNIKSTLYFAKKGSIKHMIEYADLNLQGHYYDKAIEWFTHAKAYCMKIEDTIQADQINENIKYYRNIITNDSAVSKFSDTKIKKLIEYMNTPINDNSFSYKDVDTSKIRDNGLRKLVSGLKGSNISHYVGKVVDIKKYDWNLHNGSYLPDRYTGAGNKKWKYSLKIVLDGNECCKSPWEHKNDHYSEYMIDGTDPIYFWEMAFFSANTSYVNKLKKGDVITLNGIVHDAWVWDGGHTVELWLEIP